jgi:hypothetical protein
MDRCWLKGSKGDALHAVLCAAGFNIRWLMCRIATQSAKTAEAFLFPVPAEVVGPDGTGRGLCGRQASRGPPRPYYAASWKTCPGWPSMRVRGGCVNFAGPTNEPQPGVRQAASMLDTSGIAPLALCRPCTHLRARQFGHEKSQLGVVNSGLDRKQEGPHVTHRL